MVRLVYERGELDAESTKLTAEALFWFAFSLPFSGFVLMLTRGFFSLQQPVDADDAGGRLAGDQRRRLLLPGQPLGIAGIVMGTTSPTPRWWLAEAIWLRRELGGFETRADADRDRAMLVGAAVLGVVTYGVWYGARRRCWALAAGPDRVASAPRWRRARRPTRASFSA